MKREGFEYNINDVNENKDMYLYISTRMNDGDTEAAKASYSMFRRVLAYEKKYNEMCYNFSKQEILEMYKDINYRQISTLYNVNSRLKKYTEYMIQLNKTNDIQNHYAEIDRKDLKSCINHTFIKNRLFQKEDIYNMLNSEQLVNISDKFMVLALYEGIGGSDYRELLNLTVNDIEIETDTIHTYKGRSVKATPKLITYAFEANEEKTYVSQTGKGWKRKYIPSDLIVKRMKDNVETESGRRTRYHKAMTRILNTLTFEEIQLEKFTDIKCFWHSGILHYVQDRIKELEVSFNEYVLSDKIGPELLEKFDYKFAKNNFISIFGEYFA